MSFIPPQFRIFGLLGIAGLAIAAALWLTSVLRDREALRTFKADALACEAAIGKGADTTASCRQVISDAATRARRYQECDAALAKGDAYGVRAACSAAVKLRDARATALAFDNGQLAEQLATARADLKAGLDRANARLDTLIRKDRNAQAAIAQAPRTVDGRIRCDDRCLRNLFGDETPGKGS